MLSLSSCSEGPGGTHVENQPPTVFAILLKKGEVRGDDVDPKQVLLGEHHAVGPLALGLRQEDGAEPEQPACRHAELEPRPVLALREPVNA